MTKDTVTNKTMRPISATSLCAVRQPVAPLAPHAPWVLNIGGAWFYSGIHKYRTSTS
jgi:hypothetical protein